MEPVIRGGLDNIPCNTFIYSIPSMITCNAHLPKHENNSTPLSRNSKNETMPRPVLPSPAQPCLPIIEQNHKTPSKQAIVKPQTHGTSTNKTFLLLLVFTTSPLHSTPPKKKKLTQKPPSPTTPPPSQPFSPPPSLSSPPSSAHSPSPKPLTSTHSPAQNPQYRSSYLRLS